MGRIATTTLAALVLALGPAASAAADSPLTSTTFHGAYSDVPLVADAAGQGLTPEVMRGLGDPGVPHDVRAAAVNALGWSIGGQQNARRYLDFVAHARGKPVARLRVADLSAAEAMALGYMRALDDYFDVSPIGGAGQVGRATPLTLLDHALSESGGDRAVALMRALVHAQIELHKNRWCDAYTAVFDVLNARTDPVLRPAAQQTVASYMSLYRSYC